LIFELRGDLTTAIRYISTKNKIVFSIKTIIYVQHPKKPLLNRSCAILRREGAESFVINNLGEMVAGRWAYSYHYLSIFEANNNFFG